MYVPLFIAPYPHQKKGLGPLTLLSRVHRIANRVNKGLPHPLELSHQSCSSQPKRLQQDT